MIMKKTYLLILISGILAISCNDKLAPLKKDAIAPTVVTQPLPHDTDDPAIWIHPTDATKSVIVGTDKETDGGLYMYDLKGKILKKSVALKRPNNVDIAYGLKIGDTKIDIAVTTERESNKIRVFSMPALEPIDNGGINVFEGETDRDPMGIALYTRPSDSAVFAIVGRKFGPSGTYLWQYELKDAGNGIVSATLVRKFGNFSGKKEIEAIAVDNELGFVYCSDENVGVRKYYADPAKKDNSELALFGQKDFEADQEGIAIYRSSANTGYILVSNQQANTFVVYAREGTAGKPNKHLKLAEVSTSTIECDGADATAINLGPQFPRGMLVAMSNGMTFHYYNWDVIQKVIDAGKK